MYESSGSTLPFNLLLYPPCSLHLVLFSPVCFCVLAFVTNPGSPSNRRRQICCCRSSPSDATVILNCSSSVFRRSDGQSIMPSSRQSTASTPNAKTVKTPREITDDLNPSTKRRLLVTLAFPLVLLLAVPFWWYTTSIERLPLPVDRIEALGTSDVSHYACRNGMAVEVC